MELNRLGYSAYHSVHGRPAGSIEEYATWRESSVWKELRKFVLIAVQTQWGQVTAEFQWGVLMELKELDQWLECQRFGKATVVKLHEILEANLYWPVSPTADGDLCAMSLKICL